MTAVLITLHGGNFVRGDATWDQEQTAMLASLGFIVYQLEFPLTKLEYALASIRHKVGKYKAEHPTLPCYVLGRSSGGYLAKVLFDEGLFSRAAYLAPVFSPMVRAALVPELGKESAGYFDGQAIPATVRWTGIHELLLLATEDRNVPAECFTAEQLAAAKYPGASSHAELVKLVNDDLRKCLSEFFCS
jgi:acetyl esterase/lipase